METKTGQEYCNGGCGQSTSDIGLGYCGDGDCIENPGAGFPDELLDRIPTDAQCRCGCAECQAGNHLPCIGREYQQGWQGLLPKTPSNTMPDYS